MNSKYIFFLSLFIMQGCDSGSSDVVQQEITNLIQKNKNIWVNSGVDSYTFTYFSLLYDCPQVNPHPPVEISVVNGLISSIYVPEFDLFEDVENTHYQTIDKIFESMLESVSDMKDIPSFDENFCYPKSYTIDLSEEECDGYSVMISSFI